MQQREDDTDSGLVTAARAGNRDAWSELFARYEGDLRAYARALMSPTLRAHESATDIVQTVFMDLLDKLPEFESPDGFRMWLFTQARRRVIDVARHMRAAKRDVHRERHVRTSLLQSYSNVVTPSRAAHGAEIVEAVEAALDELPERHREILTLRFFANLPPREIAESLGETDDAVRSALRRALAKLTGSVSSRLGGRDFGCAP